MEIPLGWEDSKNKKNKEDVFTHKKLKVKPEDINKFLVKYESMLHFKTNIVVDNKSGLIFFNEFIKGFCPSKLVTSCIFP